MAPERQTRAALAEYDLDAVRSGWIGRTVASSRGRYPVEHDPIRRYCHMVGDTNPLYLDPDEARAGPYGRVIVPLPLVPYFAGNGPWPRPVPTGEGRVASRSFTHGVPTPGDRGLNMNTAWAYLEPVGVGDQLAARVVIDDIFIKPVRLDPAAIWIVTLTSIRNQVDQVVMETRNTVLVHRSRAELTGDE
jgi:acyl dehydratase